jgi:hypothetical protein
MSTNTPPSGDQPKNGFFIHQGTFNGRFTTPGGEEYNIRKLEPRDLTDPRDGAVTKIWGGYAAARRIDRETKDYEKPKTTNCNATSKEPASDPAASPLSPRRFRSTSRCGSRRATANAPCAAAR